MSSSDPGANISFQPMTESFAADPYSVYAQLRLLDEPYLCPTTGAYMLSRYTDVEAAARDARLVRSAEVFLSPQACLAQQRARNWHDMPNHERFVQFSLLDSDGEIHDRLRRLVMRHMSRRFVEQQRAKIRAFVSSVLDAVLPQGEIDFVADVAKRIPGHIIGSVLGVPDEDCVQLRIWSEDIVQFFDVGRTQADKERAERATTEFYLYLRSLIDARRKQPQNDLVSALIEDQRQGRLSETELVSTCMLILMAGHGSTIDVLSTGLYALLVHDEAMSRLRAEPELLPQSVQEMFRYESPLPFFHRYASEDIEVMGKTYPQGTMFGLLYGAANRDPQQFPDADLFVVDRAPNRHVAFGRGAHLCLGNQLSRIDMEVIFALLLQRTVSIELLKEPKYKLGLSTRGLQSLRVRLAAS